ncbi:MAG: hypothetical protein AAB583_03840, partial [Patescibacteria group bacterium]
MKKIIMGFTLFVSIIFHNNLWAWNADITHRDLSKIVAQKSQIADGSYIKNIGYEKGLELVDDKGAEVQNSKISRWIELIKDGAIEEDAGNIFTAYYYNHFHDPLALSWSQAGLSTWYPGINGMSSLLWAQNTTNPWNWQKTREYFYTALTGKDYSGNLVAVDKTQRDAYFAKTFQGLGHIIHLVEDVAQPAHVRNDPHPLDDIGVVPQFENWAKNNRSTASSFMSNPVFPSVSLDTSVGGYIPITQLWDTNQYNGSNSPSGTNIGLSEYTNANFFSEDTINVSNFTYPDITQTTVTERNFTNTFWNTIYPREYYLKNCCGETNTNQGYLLSAVDYLDYYRQQYPSLSFGLPKIPV